VGGVDKPLPAALVCRGIGRPALLCATTTNRRLPMSISRMSRQRPSWSLLGSIGLYHPPFAAEALTIARTNSHALRNTQNAARVRALIRGAKSRVRMTASISMGHDVVVIIGRSRQAPRADHHRWCIVSRTSNRASGSRTLLLHKAAGASKPCPTAPASLAIFAAIRRALTATSFRTPGLNESIVSLIYAR
jgi:hypothetical protein